MFLKMLVVVTLLVLFAQAPRYADAPFTSFLTDSFGLLPFGNLTFQADPNPDSTPSPDASRISVPKDGVDAEKMGAASYAVYQLATRIAQRIEQKFVDIKSIYSPRVEQISMGDLMFNISLSYGWDFSHKKVNATITFDEIKKRRK